MSVYNWMGISVYESYVFDHNKHNIFFQNIWTWTYEYRVLLTRELCSSFNS